MKIVCSKSNLVKHIIGLILLNSIIVSNLSNKLEEKSGILTLVTITA